jgi:hypothetical protein
LKKPAAWTIPRFNGIDAVIVAGFKNSLTDLELLTKKHVEFLCSLAIRILGDNLQGGGRLIHLDTCL